MCEMARWTIFSLLDADFAADVRFALVFGSTGNEALLFTHSDDAFALGSNQCGCLGALGSLGIGNGQSSLEPIKLESLHGRRVGSVAFGAGPHILALTDDGEIYAWGHNGYGQLGTGSTNPGMTPVLVVGNLANNRVVQVACGSHHSVAVTDQGLVFSWGQNSCGQVGIGSNVNQSTPRRVGGNIASRFIKSVACGQNSTLAVTNNGEVYSWGYNGNGQLGIGNNSNQLGPCRVMELQKDVISQVVCGFAHALALSDVGELYAWGSNSCGQLGVNSRTNQLIPTRTAVELGRVVEAAAVHACNMSAATTQSGKVFMWGQVRGQSVSAPQETRFGCVDDAFACFATPAVSWRPIAFARPEPNTIEDSVRAAFDDATTADVRFKIDGHTLHLHRALLKIRCQHFRSMFNENGWSEANGECVEISQFPYGVYRAFLYYLYTDTVDVSPEEAIGLLDLANSYCEAALKRKCEQIIRRGIAVDNAVFLFAAALRFQARDLEEYCFQFCLNHMTAVTQTEAFARLDEASVKHFVAQAARHGAFKN